MKTKIVTVLIAITVIVPGLLKASDSENKKVIEESYYSNLEIDSWMIDLSSWVSKGETTMTVSEEALSVEKWMLNPNHQSWGDSPNENSIQLENWMIDLQNSNWETGQSEPELNLENWMIDLTSWAAS